MGKLGLAGLLRISGLFKFGVRVRSQFNICRGNMTFSAAV